MVHFALRDHQRRLHTIDTVLIQEGVHQMDGRQSVNCVLPLGHQVLCSAGFVGGTPVLRNERPKRLELNSDH